MRARTFLTAVAVLSFGLLLLGGSSPAVAAVVEALFVGLMLVGAFAAWRSTCRMGLRR